MSKVFHYVSTFEEVDETNYCANPLSKPHKTSLTDNQTLHYILSNVREAETYRPHTSMVSMVDSDTVMK
jgi:hypothetical protein